MTLIVSHFNPLQFFIEIILYAVLWHWGRDRLSEREADNLTTFMCQMFRNVGASNSWQLQGLSKPVVGLLYTFTFIFLSGRGVTMTIHPHPALILKKGTRTPPSSFCGFIACDRVNLYYFCRKF